MIYKLASHIIMYNITDLSFPFTYRFALHLYVKYEGVCVCVYSSVPPPYSLPWAPCWSAQTPSQTLGCLDGPQWQSSSCRTLPCSLTPEEKNKTWLVCRKEKC